MVRTRFAPSPTGSMHIGNFRTALYEYLIAKHYDGTFILRIEDTDKKRYVPGAEALIYNNLKLTGLLHDEGPDVGGAYGPYIQSERIEIYQKYAMELVENGKAYRCFCEGGTHDPDADRHEVVTKYDRKCLRLSPEEIDQKLADGVPYAIRQIIPEGETTFTDMVFGDITISHDELDDQILIKKDGFPTYNFANVVDDHLMDITHVMRGNEYLSSTPKYNLLYEAFGWQIPKYIHVSLIVNKDGSKLAKRKGDMSFNNFLEQGFLPEALVNYIALLGWAPSDNTEFFTLPELVKAFDISGLSKSPSTFDLQKLTWMNGEYFKTMDAERFSEMAMPVLKDSITRADINLTSVAEMVKTRICFLSEIPGLVDFIDTLPDYDTELYVHKKMKTDRENCLSNLKQALPVLEALEIWDNEHIYGALIALVEQLGIKNGQMLWPIRTSLSGRPTSPCGASELCELLGKADCIDRIKEGIKKLEG